MKKFSLAFLVLLAVAVATIWSVDSKTYGSFAARRLIQLARDNGISVSIEQARLTLNSFSCSDLGVVLTKPPVFFHSQDAICQISPLRFLAGPQLSCSGNLYRGTFTGAFSGTWPGDSGQLSATLANVDLKEHPQLLGLGIQSGSISGGLRDGKLTKGKLNAGVFELALTDFSRPEQIRLPLNIIIPGIQGLTGTIKGQLSVNQLTVTQGDLNSQFGSMHTTGDVGLNEQGQAVTLNLSSEIRLSDQGLQVFGQYLVLLGSPTVTNETRNFRVTITGSPNHPVWGATRI